VEIVEFILCPLFNNIDDDDVAVVVVVFEAGNKTDADVADKDDIGCNKEPEEEE